MTAKGIPPRLYDHSFSCLGVGGGVPLYCLGCVPPVLSGEYFMVELVFTFEVAFELRECDDG